MHSTIPSVTCLRLSDASVICRVTYFQFPIQSAFLPRWSQAAAECTWFTQYRTSDVAENVGSTFLVRGVLPRWRIKLILTVTRWLYCVERTQYSISIDVQINDCLIDWRGPLYVIGVSLGPPESSTRTISRSLQKFRRAN